MHIIFGYISFWQLPIMKLLKFLKFEVFYLYLNPKTEANKNKISNNLRRSNIYPLPLEFEKKKLAQGILT